MLIAFNKTIAVHDSRTGARLWKTDIEEADGVISSHAHVSRYYFRFFITEVTAGYAMVNRESETRRCIRLYDTKSGVFIASFKIPYGRIEILSSGPFVCFHHGRTVQAIKVDKGEAKKYEFEFPFEDLVYKKKQPPPTRRSIQRLLGFVGKTNILVGLMDKTQGLGHLIESGVCKVHPSLFSLDLDFAMAARSETESKKAFDFPMAQDHSEETCYLPMYKTDREKERIDLVGVMSKSRDVFNFQIFPNLSKLTVQTHLFVTDMQYPEDQ